MKWLFFLFIDQLFLIDGEYPPTKIDIYSNLRVDMGVKNKRVEEC